MSAPNQFPARDWALCWSRPQRKPYCTAGWAEQTYVTKYSSTLVYCNASLVWCTFSLLTMAICCYLIKSFKDASISWHGMCALVFQASTAKMCNKHSCQVSSPWNKLNIHMNLSKAYNYSCIFFYSNSFKILSTHFETKQVYFLFNRTKIY